ncbi:MAG: GNAT family N-acetyltransferase [Cytophagia bacterium]|nr:MAG: GNAT family N-acetyltransferase [Runella sp.]TAG25095.1 MAG: GNAT family N-acetyltransferase [Cytophagales bacterium]TAG37516.1 MAG: GNAT family N-acetyltransferase [Cytophagia bacterium]TAG55237.1 MAG: GNAT family N-acetyltransferase [Runella slithyformis]TAG84554.1 MAG: GNAT family N-acetyltransferase [Cytophagales bacterium]
MLQYTTLQTDAEIEQLLALQRANLYKNTPTEYQQDQGFTTVEHTFELIQTMNNAAPQVIAKDQDVVVGYALVMPESFQDLIPDLKPMFVEIAQVSWQQKPISAYRFYAMGQICVAESHRGMGVFDGLYATHKALLSSQFDLCVTEVAVRNTRSMRAHERVGFKAIHQYQDHTDLWNVVVWNWS